MKKLVIAALATTILAAAAVPAFAHDDGDDDWTAESYGAFDQQYHHIWDGIQHGLSDGSYTPGQAHYFYRELRSIQARAYWEQQEGCYNPGEINARLESLHARMHVAHQEGHERLESGYYGGGHYGGGYYSPGYNPQPYGYGRTYGYVYYGRRW